MPAKKRYQSKKIKQKPKLGLIIRIFLLIVFLVTLPIAYYLMTQNQDVRQQAAGCNEEQVNTQFRKYIAGTDKPWTDGNKMSVKIGDKIDVNCFAKTGTALLSNGKISLKVDGVAKTIPSSAIKNQGKSLSGYEITEGGIHAFTCANNAGCSNTDSVSVPKPSPSPSPTVTPSPSPSASPTPTTACTQDAKQCPDGTYVSRVAPSCDFAPCPSSDSCQNLSVADLNKDCTVDLKDYDLFLSEFIKGQR